MTPSPGPLQRRERRAIATVFAWSLAVLALLYLLLAYVQRREARLERSIARHVDRLRAYERPVEGKSLAERMVAERQKRRYLLGEWKRYSNLLDTWQTRQEPADGEPGEAARIDFKVALFNARERLARRAAEADATLPAGIGISESIEADEDASLRLLQLAAVEKLVGFALEQKLPEILEIEALPPDPIPAADGGDEYLDRYPIRLRLRCSLNGFVRFLAQIMRARHFFTVANVYAVKATATHSDLLDVTVVFNALVMKEEREAEPVRRRPHRRRRTSS